MARKRIHKRRRMTHHYLVEMAYKWLIHTRGCKFAFKEFSSPDVKEVPDAIGFLARTSILIECKVSRADFLKDRKKMHRRLPGEGLGGFRFFMAPKGLISVSELPDKWGLIEVNGDKSRMKYGPRTKRVDQWISEGWLFERNEKAELGMLMSALRRIHIHGQIDKIYERPTLEMLNSAN